MGNIPFKSLRDNASRDNASVCADILTTIINKDLSNSSFPDKLKNADVTQYIKVRKQTQQTNKFTDR